jgi:peptidoglycan/xylan/chitin deacetylase (PgdA/CDA1 family)/GT2 family glycosyltransferase
MSVVVCAYRNDPTILQAVGSLLDQDFDEPFEVIVVTSGEGRTLELVRDRYPEVRIVESAVRLMPGGARNRGVEVAFGDVVAFLEGDCVARPGWIRDRMEAHHAGHEAVASTVAVANDGYAAARVTAYLCYDNRLERSPRGPAGIPRSYGLSFTRGLLKRAGPFDEALRIAEDSLMAQRLGQLGVEAWFEPSVCVEHFGPERLRDLFLEQAARGRRQARCEILSNPRGGMRVRMESRAPHLALMLRTMRRLFVRSRFLVRNLRRCAPDLMDVARTSPWIALGLVANVLGWAREQRAYMRTGCFTELDGAGLSQAPLRRRTTTTGERTLLLTFDDGPSDFTQDTLDVLAEHEVPATFFALGESVAAKPAMVSAVAEAGHDLGIHGWSHADFTELCEEELEREVLFTRERICEVVGLDVRGIRPPFGRYDGDSCSWLARHEFVTWLWTADARDYEADTSVDRIVGNVLSSLTPGGIVLMHDGGGDRSKTVLALPRIIEGARDLGFHFVALRDVKAASRLLVA